MVVYKIKNVVDKVNAMHSSTVFIFAGGCSGGQTNKWNRIQSSKVNLPKHFLCSRVYPKHQGDHNLKNQI